MFSECLCHPHHPCPLSLYSSFHVITLRNVPLLLSNIKISLVSFLVCSLNVAVIVILIFFVMPYLLITLILQGQKSLGVCFKNEKLNHISNRFEVLTNIFLVVSPQTSLSSQSPPTLTCRGNLPHRCDKLQCFHSQSWN